MEDIAKFLKVLSEPLRLRLAVLLAQESEVCVCHLVDAVEEPQFKVSRHLGVMRNAGLVQTRRQGVWIYYRLAREVMETGYLEGIFEYCLGHKAQVRKDLKRLQRSCAVNKIKDGSCGKG